mgnify:CR=1 FL=1
MEYASASVDEPMGYASASVDEPMGCASASVDEPMGCASASVDSPIAGVFSAFPYYTLPIPYNLTSRTCSLLSTPSLACLVCRAVRLDPVSFIAFIN